MDSTQMPVYQGYEYLLVIIDTFTEWTEGFLQTEKAEEVVKKNCFMKSFQDLVFLGHYKVTMGHHLLLRSPKGSLKHWVLLIISIVPQSSKRILKISNKKEPRRPPWDGRRLYQQLSSAPILPLRNMLVLVLMRCYMGDLLFVSMTSSQIQRLRPSGLIPWLLGNFNRIYACGVSTRTQKILKSHHYMLQGLKS